jgi:hypothetical protein
MKISEIKEVSEIFGTPEELIKCSDQPVAFYDAIVEARDARALVKEKVDELGKLVTQYSNQVKELRTAALSAEQQAEANT